MPQPTGNVFARLEELAVLGPPTVELTCALPALLVDPEEWRLRCEEERTRYDAVLHAAGSLSDRRERRKAGLLTELTEKHPRVLAFDHHLITLFVLERLLEGQAQEVLVATGRASQVRKEVERPFARSPTGAAFALCSHALNEWTTHTGEDTVGHLDRPTP